MKLYEIADKYKRLMDELENSEKPDGVISEEWIEAIKQVEDEGNQKLINVGLTIKNFKAEAEMLRAHKKQVEAKIKAMDQKIEWLEYYAYNNMNEMKVREIQDPLIRLSIQKSPFAVDYDDESKVPEEFFKISKSVDKMKLKSAIINDNLQIDGVRVIQSEYLKIS